MLNRSTPIPTSEIDIKKKSISAYPISPRGERQVDLNVFPISAPVEDLKEKPSDAFTPPVFKRGKKFNLLEIYFD